MNLKRLIALLALLPSIGSAQVAINALPSGSAISGANFAICDQASVTNKCTYTQVATFVGSQITPLFNQLTSGTNTAAAMLVGTGASLGPSGTGTVTANLLSSGIALGTPASGTLTNATGLLFSGIATASNTTATMTLGSGGTLTFSGSGVVNANQANGVAFGTFATANAATPPAIGGTTPAAGAFTTLSATGNLTTNVTGSTQCLHVSTAGLVSGTGSDCGAGGSAAFSALTGGTNTTAAMLVGTGASLGVSGSGTIVATSLSATLGVAAGGTGATTLTGPIKGNGVSAFSAAAAADIFGLWSGTCSASTFLRGDGSCQTPAGGGNVSNSGTPTVHQTGVWVSATTIAGVGPGSTGQAFASTGASTDPAFTSSLSAVTSVNSSTVPASTTLAGLGTVETWTAAQTFTNSDILLLGSSTGATTFTSANAGASNFTLTFPAATDTVVTLAATQTLTNKSIAASEVNSGTLAAAQMPALTGDVTSTSGTVATTVGKINGTALSGLATGLLKNTTTTGVPSIATSADVIADWSGTCSASTFLRGDGSCQTPAGGGNVSNSGTPTAHQTGVWVTATTLAGVGPGTSGLPFVSGGASADPSFAALALSGLATQVTATVVANTSGSTAAPTAVSLTSFQSAMVAANAVLVADAAPGSGPTNDYSPTGYGTTTAVLYVTPAAGGTTFNGLVAGNNMQQVFIVNAEAAGGADLIKLVNQSASDTTAANRFLTSATVSLAIPAGGRVGCIYFAGSINRWSCQ